MGSRQERVSKLSALLRTLRTLDFFRSPQETLEIKARNGSPPRNPLPCQCCSCSGQILGLLLGELPSRRWGQLGICGREQGNPGEGAVRKLQPTTEDSGSYKGTCC